MVYMDFEALMKNSLPLWVYCVCTNCGDGVRQECPPPDRLLQDVVMENKKIRFGEKLVMVIERSAVKVVYVDVEGHSIRQKGVADSDGSVCSPDLVFARLSSSVVSVQNEILCPWLNEMKACGALEIHLALLCIIIFDLLLVS